MRLLDRKMEPKNTALAVPCGFPWARLGPLGGPLGGGGGFGSTSVCPITRGIIGTPKYSFGCPM